MKLKKDKIYIIALIVLFVDQCIKYLVVHNLALMERIVVIKNFFSFSYIQNTGAAWGAFDNSTFLLTIITGALLIFLNVYIKKSKSFSKWNILSYGFLVGGILGNFIDRIVRGFVVDYFDFTIFGYHFPVFNLADTFIIIGVILFIIDIFKEESVWKSDQKKIK